MNKATNMGGKFWSTPKGAATYRSASKKFGIINSDGEALFCAEGDQPMVWPSLKIAKQCAPYCDEFANTYWGKVYNDSKEVA